jgi:hypothetical protein
MLGIRLLILIVLILAFSPVHAQNDADDAQAQAEMLAQVPYGAAVPYHPDQRLSQKARSLQTLYDLAMMATYAPACNFPKYNPDALWNVLMSRVLADFHDGRDENIAMNHFNEHTIYRTSVKPSCPGLQLTLNQLRIKAGLDE